MAITVFKNPRVEAYANENYNTGFIPHSQLYPGINADAKWQNAKRIARQAFGIQRRNDVAKINKKQIYNQLIPNDEGQ